MLTRLKDQNARDIYLDASKVTAITAYVGDPTASRRYSSVCVETNHYIIQGSPEQLIQDLGIAIRDPKDSF